MLKLKQFDADQRAGTNSDHALRAEEASSMVLPVTSTGSMVSVVALPQGHGLLPLTLSIGQVIAWTGLKKTKVQELANEGELVTSKVSGRTLWLTCSVIALIERNRVDRGR